MKRWSTFAYKLAHLSNKQKKDSLGSLWDCWTKGHETWRDVSGLQCIGHPVSTRQNTPDKSRHRCSPAAGSQLERWKGHSNSSLQQYPRLLTQKSTDPRVLHFVHDVITGEWYETWQQGNISTDTDQTKLYWKLIMSTVVTHRLCVQQTHRAVLTNWRQSGSSQLLQTKWIELVLQILWHITVGNIAYRKHFPKPSGCWYGLLGYTSFVTNISDTN